MDLLKRRPRRRDDTNVRARLRTVVLLAVVLAVSDLGYARWKRHVDPAFVHHRSHGWVILSLALLVAMLLLSRLPSRLLAVACGLVAGGTLGNLIWAVGHRDLVANSIVLQRSNSGIAFTLADVYVLSGILLLIAASMRMTILYRHVLPRSTVTGRLIRRLSQRRA